MGSFLDALYGTRYRARTVLQLKSKTVRMVFEQCYLKQNEVTSKKNTYKHILKYTSIYHTKYKYITYLYIIYNLQYIHLHINLYNININQYI